ncbi:cytochrome P450 [Hypoxylon fragiforme]|uniref:cytochrome P450 n=1 Tax=Hypoxylon fragiforme TaxID=63214 RepID=UPI0020C66666|nr:cytochrome P450 [Hypoxylon fragiforme]KAI2612348.1 cytochrome P450 [Hypoxylon fragiforme]
MDVVVCASIAAIEWLVLLVLGGVFQLGYATPKTALILFSLQYGLIKFYRVFLYHRYVSPFRHLPGPTNNHFFFGQAINFIKCKSPPELYLNWMKEFPEAPVIRYLTFANTEVLVCNSLNAFKDVLQTRCYAFHKPVRWRRMMVEITGKGVLSLEGEEHRQHRKMLTGAFSTPNVRKLDPVFRYKTKELGDVLDSAIGTGDSTVIDCTEVFSKATLDIIGITVLGVELTNLKSISTKDQKRDKGKRYKAKKDYTFHEAYEVIFSQSLIGKILFFANAFVPTRWLPLEANREFAFATNWLREVLLELIRERHNKIDQARLSGKYESVKKDSRDLLSYIIEESMPGGPAENIAEENFLGHLLQFMAAGHATSADTLTWSLYTMATNQEIQKQVRDEIADLAIRKPDMPFSDIDNLPYLNNFIKEVLRLYAPSTSHHREAGEDMVIDGVFVPKGTTFDIIPAMPMLNPAIWGDNAEEADPTRWDRLTPDQASPFAFEAFSNGPRMCIGKIYAMMEIKIILVELVQRFRFFSVDKPFTIENPGFALRPNGLEVRLERVNA